MNVFAPFVSFYESWLYTGKGILLLVKQWYYLADSAGVLPGPFTMILVPLFLFLYLSNGFIAATYTEMQGRSRLSHFLVALCLPVMYPMMASKFKNLLADHMRVKKEREENMRAGMMHLVTAKLYENTGQEYVPSPVIPATQPEVEEEAQPEYFTEDGGVTMNSIYFKSIALNADGSQAGPFIVVMQDGREMEALRIADILDDVVVFELAGPEGKVRTIRAKYDKIAACQLRS